MKCKFCDKEIISNNKHRTRCYSCAKILFVPSAEGKPYSKLETKNLTPVQREEKLNFFHKLFKRKKVKEDKEKKEKGNIK